MAFGPRLVGERVLLRDLLSTDVDARQALGRQAEIQRTFGAAQPVTAAMTRSDAEAWATALGGDDRIEWVVEADGSFLGTARLHAVDGVRAKYAVGFFDPARLGRGFGTEVTRLVLGYAFETLGLRGVTLAVLAINDRALRCYRRCGFEEADRVPGAVVVEGHAVDDVVMAVTWRSFRSTA